MKLFYLIININANKILSPIKMQMLRGDWNIKPIMRDSGRNSSSATFPGNRWSGVMEEAVCVCVGVCARVCICVHTCACVCLSRIAIPTIRFFLKSHGPLQFTWNFILCFWCFLSLVNIFCSICMRSTFQNATHKQDPNAFAFLCLIDLIYIGISLVYLFCTW